MKQSLQDYQKLHEISKRNRTLQGVSMLLEWDQETHMPRAAAPFRADQIQIMAGMVHKDKTSKKFVNALSKLIDLKSGTILAKGISNAQISALKAWRRDYLIDTALPQNFVEAFAKLTSQSMEAWKEAKITNQYTVFAPFLKKIVEMSRQKADYIGYKDHPYDALIDLFEPDMNSKTISTLFNSLKKSLITLVQKIASKSQVNDSFLHGKFSTEKQMDLGRQLLTEMGYDFHRGALDISSHPFSTSQHPTDSRVTTRMHPTTFMSNISVVLHEGGHSLYEMGLPVEHFGSPLAEALSHGMHESQSRWWETRIGQSLPYWKHYFPLVQKVFKGKLEKVTLDQFYKAINKVEPSMIRVEADEVTYSLHVIIRYEIEKALIEGSLQVEDIPEAWNEKMEQYLGIRPETDDQGCLQDIHWSLGALGYFPSYTLGNLYAAHLFEKFAKDHPDWEKRVSTGELFFIKNWLHQHVHQYGRQYSCKDLLKKATGKAFSADAYLDYLQSKYKGIYRF